MVSNGTSNYSKWDRMARVRPAKERRPQKLNASQLSSLRAFEAKRAKPKPSRVCWLERPNPWDRSLEADALRAQLDADVKAAHERWVR